MMLDLRISIYPEICGGKPTIAGTRIMVSIILEYIEEGHSFDEIIENYPGITHDDIRAVIRYARRLVEGEKVVYFKNNELSDNIEKIFDEFDETFKELAK